VKKIFSAFMAAALLAVTGCAENIEPNNGAPKDTPVRVGEGFLSISLDKDYTLEVAFESADIIADITVMGWEGESEFTTFFSVKPNQIFKGEAPETFTIMQTGSSSCTMSGYPLFKRGDRLLLFLFGDDPEATYYESVKQYKDRHWIVGSHTTTMYIYEYEGEVYVLGNSSATRFMEGFIKNYNAEKINEELSAAIIADYNETDPVMAGASDFSGHVFKCGGIAEIIADMVETEES
jgi:hypothetical protein